MKNINPTLLYILTFIGVAAVSFGITFGALSAFAKEDDTEQIDTEISDSTPHEESIENTEPDTQDQSGWRAETIAINEATSIDIRLPEGWAVESNDPATEDSSTKFIKSPALVGEDKNPTDIHFCLAFNNFTTPGTQDQVTIETPSTINTEVTVFNNPATAQIKINEQRPESPFLFVSNSTSDAPVSSVFTLPDTSLLTIVGLYGCDGPTEVVNAFPTAEEFNSQPEVQTAIEIISTASLVSQNQNTPAPDATNPDNSNPDAATSSPANPSDVAPQIVQ